MHNEPKYTVSAVFFIVQVSQMTWVKVAVCLMSGAALQTQGNAQECWLVVQECRLWFQPRLCFGDFSTFFFDNLILKVYVSHDPYREKNFDGTTLENILTFTQVIVNFVVGRGCRHCEPKSRPSKASWSTERLKQLCYLSGTCMYCSETRLTTVRPIASKSKLWWENHVSEECLLLSFVRCCCACDWTFTAKHLADAGNW